MILKKNQNEHFSINIPIKKAKTQKEKKQQKNKKKALKKASSPTEKYEPKGDNYIILLIANFFRETTPVKITLQQYQERKNMQNENVSKTLNKLLDHIRAPQKIVFSMHVLIPICEKMPFRKNLQENLQEKSSGKIFKKNLQE